MVRALDRALRVPARLGVADARTAMPADVVEAAELLVLPADDDDALAGDVDGDEIARFGRLVGPRDVHPFAEEHPLPVELVDLRRAVVVAGKGRPELTHLVPNHTNRLDTSCYVGLHCAKPTSGEDEMHPRERRTTRRHFLFGSAGAVAALSGADALLQAADALAGRLGGPIGPGRHPARAARAIRSPSRSTPTTIRSPAASTPRRGRSTSSTGRTTSTRRSEEVREGVQRQGQDHDVRERGGGAREAHVGTSELRRVVRDRRLPLAHRRRQAHPAGQPLVPPEPEERVAAAAEPVLRRALALLGAVHRLHDRHRVAEGQGEDAADRVQERLRRVLARTEVRRQGRDPRRPARGDRNGAPPSRRAATSTPRARSSCKRRRTT